MAVAIIFRTQKLIIMYFEARIHQLLPVENALKAAEVIKERKSDNIVLWSNSVLSYTNENGEFFIVPDGHIDNPFQEVAFLKKTDKGYEQTETITAAWIDTPEALAKYFVDAESEISMSVKDIMFDKPDKDKTANFTCGCCGDWFKGNVAEQLKFDQDSGYGICKKCERYYK